MPETLEHYQQICLAIEAALGRLLEPGELAMTAVLARGGVGLEDWRTAIATTEPFLLAFPPLLWAALTAAADR